MNTPPSSSPSSVSSPSGSLDLLERVLGRALKRASIVQQADLKRRLLAARSARANADKKISVDFTHRLQDRATFRALLADPQLDAARFRWFFTEHWEGPHSLDEMRRFIDERMNKNA